jgi:hypothetical protein
LLEEGEDGLVGIFGFHVSEERWRAEESRDGGTLASESADDPRAGKGGGPEA